MQEWFNWPAWKASVPQKGTGGSNPPLSATTNYSCGLPWEFCFQFGRTKLVLEGRNENKMTRRVKRVRSNLELQDPPQRDHRR